MTKKTNVIVLKDVRIAFPHVYTPVRPYGTEDKTEEEVSKLKEWSAQIRISKEQFDQVKELISKVAQEKWGQKATQMLKKIATNSPKTCAAENLKTRTPERLTTPSTPNAKNTEARTVRAERIWLPRRAASTGDVQRQKTIRRPSLTDVLLTSSSHFSATTKLLRVSDAICAPCNF